MTKLVRIFRLLSSDSQTSHLVKKLKTGSGFQRLFFFSLLSLLMIHISACLFLFLGMQMQGVTEEKIDSWLDSYIDDQWYYRYICAVYFTIMTFTTVGYGDITPKDSIERIYACILMLLGIICYSILISSLTSII